MRKYICHYDYIVSDKGRGNFLTLQEAVDAVPADVSATILVLDGKFKKPQTTKKIKYDVRSTAELQ